MAGGEGEIVFEAFFLLTYSLCQDLSMLRCNIFVIDYRLFWMPHKLRLKMILSLWPIFFWTVGLREHEAGSDMIGSVSRGHTGPKGVALEPPCGISCITATTLI